VERENAKNIERKENSGGIMVEEVMRFMEVGTNRVVLFV